MMDVNQLIELLVVTDSVDENFALQDKNDKVEKENEKSFYKSGNNKKKSSKVLKK